MNVRRAAVAAVALWLGGVCVTACSAKIVSSGSTTSPGGSTTSPGSSTASPGGSTSSPGQPTVQSSLPGDIPKFPVGGASTKVVDGRVKVGGPLGSFPVPPGANVILNEITGRTDDLVLGSVTPSRVSSFYASALPHEGYTVTNNTSATGSSFAGTSIKFTGHGYQGTIGAAAGLSSLSSIIGTTGNVVGIVLTRQ